MHITHLKNQYIYLLPLFFLDFYPLHMYLYFEFKHTQVWQKKIFCNILKVKNHFLIKGADHCMVSRISNLKNIHFLKQIDFCSFAVFFRPNKTRSDSFKQLWKFWIRDFEIHRSFFENKLSLSYPSTNSIFSQAPIWTKGE